MSNVPHTLMSNPSKMRFQTFSTYYCFIWIDLDILLYVFQSRAPHTLMSNVPHTLMSNPSKMRFQTFSSYYCFIWMDLDILPYVCQSRFLIWCAFKVFLQTTVSSTWIYIYLTVCLSIPRTPHSNVSFLPVTTLEKINFESYKRFNCLAIWPFIIWSSGNDD